MNNIYTYKALLKYRDSFFLITYFIIIQGSHFNYSILVLQNSQFNDGGRLDSKSRTFKSKKNKSF